LDDIIRETDDALRWRSLFEREFDLWTMQALNLYRLIDL